MTPTNRDLTAAFGDTVREPLASAPWRRRPILMAFIAAVMALFVWNYLVVAQAQRWAGDTAYAAARSAFAATSADLAALAVAEQRLLKATKSAAASWVGLDTFEQERSRAESRIHAARESYAQAGRSAATRTVDRTGFLMSAPEWLAYLAVLWLLALVPASTVVGALFPVRAERASQTSGERVAGE
jgi:hypothetical protein